MILAQKLPSQVAVCVNSRVHAIIRSGGLYVDAMLYMLSHLSIYLWRIKRIVEGWYGGKVGGKGRKVGRIRVKENNVRRLFVTPQTKSIHDRLMRLQDVVSHRTALRDEGVRHLRRPIK